MLKNIPIDINAEVLLDAFPDNTFKVKLQGLHKRNTYRDVLDIEEHLNGTSVLYVARNSLYNSLPECMFHQVDRFDNKPDSGAQARFEEEVARQQKEEDSAYRLFAPVDLMLFQLRRKMRKAMLPYVQENKVLQDILTDTLTEKQRQNRFIKRTIPFVVAAKNIRGDRTLITLMLRKVFMHEGLFLQPMDVDQHFVDEAPRYNESVGGEGDDGCVRLGDVIVGNEYDENIHAYKLRYWDEDVCDRHFLDVVEEAEEYRQFVQDYFLSIEHLLIFDVVSEHRPMNLDETEDDTFLGFNTFL